LIYFVISKKLLKFLKKQKDVLKFKNEKILIFQCLENC